MNTQSVNSQLAPRFQYKCYGCGTHVPLGPTTHCACGEPYAIEWIGTYDTAVFLRTPQSLWDYAELLPVVNPDAAPALGEGSTPLVRSARLHEEYGYGELLWKNEAANPTGSFKDRQIAVGITHARECGHDTVAVVSSGNVACAASAFAARAGMKAVVFTHTHAAPSKIRQAMAYGARVLRVNTDSAERGFQLCIEACKNLGWYHLSTAGIYEAFNVEGAKTIAYELYAQTGGNLPDWLVAPVGGGGLLGGVWRGFLDLQRLGLIQHAPRIIGVQAAGCAPLVDAIRNATPFLETLRNPWTDPHTIAGGIADDILFDGHTALQAIRQTGGTAIAVTDDEIVHAELGLARHEGLLAEPSSTVTVAALAKLPEEARSTRVCCLVTGTGIKDLDVLRGHVSEAPVVEPALADVQRALDEYERCAAL